jgi:hypothetical protein
MSPDYNVRHVETGLDTAPKTNFGSNSTPCVSNRAKWTPRVWHPTKIERIITPMNRRKWVVMTIVVVVGGAAAIVAYRTFARHHDIQETLLWMDQTYNPHDGGENFGQGHGCETHYLVHSQDHTEELTEKFQTTFIHKNGCTIVIHEETFPVGVYKTVYSKSDYTVNLSDIDPASIRIRTFDLRNDVFDCSDPESVRVYQLNCDAAEIDFQTRNAAPTIAEDSLTTYSELQGSDHESRRSTKTNSAWFDVDDVPYARRFARALNHAVEVCGGKASKF